MAVTVRSNYTINYRVLLQSSEVNLSNYLNETSRQSANVGDSS